MQFGPRARRWLAPFVLLWALAPAAQASVQSELAFHRGVIAYGEERYDEAANHFGLVLAEDPEDTTALQYMALISEATDDPGAALGYYDRALAVDPDDTEILLSRGTLLLETGQIAEAQQAFARVIELEPDNARAQLLAGMASYRAGDHEAAKPYLEKAADLDPTLRDESRYYSGLSEAMIGNMQAAAAAFNDAATQSPLSPLGQSAQNFQQRIEQPDQPPRPWQASFATGVEVDSNPRLIGDSTVGTPIPRDRETDGRVVLRPSASYRFYEDGPASVTAGYDGYLSVHFSQTLPNLWTHNAWLAGSYDLGPVRLGLRGDYAFTMIDTVDPLRHLFRINPSALIQHDDWGATLLYYQFYYEDWEKPPNPDVLDRDAFGHAPGLSQFFFLPEPFTYVRIGLRGIFLDTDGTEFEHDGVEVQFGAGYDFDHGISLGWLYEYEFRSYDNPSTFSGPPMYKRTDDQHQLTAELSKMLTAHWKLSAGTQFTWNESNVPFYDIDRYVGGVYLTYYF